jgi:hypothetical protein
MNHNRIELLVCLCCDVSCILVKLEALNNYSWKSSQNLRSISNKYLTLRRYPRSIIEETIDAFRTCGVLRLAAYNTEAQARNDSQYD